MTKPTKAVIAKAKRTIANCLSAPQRQGRIFEMPSLTVPDENMDLKTILKRHSQGMPIIGQQPLYEDEHGSSGINPRTLDFIDIQNLRNSTKQEVDRLTKDLADYKMKRSRLEADQKLKAEEREKKIAQLLEQNP